MSIGFGALKLHFGSHNLGNWDTWSVRIYNQKLLLIDYNYHFQVRMAKGARSRVRRIEILKWVDLRLTGILY